MATHSNDTDGKESACSAGDLGSVPGSGKSSGEGHGNPLQYSCLENSMYREPGGLQSMGLQRVEHECAINRHTHTHTFLTDLLLTASVATSYNREIEVGAQRSLESRNR